MMSFAMQKLFRFLRFHLLLILAPVLMVFCPGNFFLCQLEFNANLCFLFYEVLFLCGILWFIRSWVLCKVVSVGLFRFFYIHPSCLISIICVLKMLFFCSLYLGFFIKKNHLWFGVWNFFWVYNSILSIDISIFVAISMIWTRFKSHSRISIIFISSNTYYYLLLA